jgi:hypothetical protein
MRVTLSAFLLLVPMLAIGQTGADARAAFKLCESEAFATLSSGRFYLLNERKADAVLPFLSSDALSVAVAQETFSELDTDRSLTPASSATRRLRQCADRMNSGFDRPRYVVEECFLTAEVALYVHMAAATSTSQADTVQRVEKWLPDRSRISKNLISLVVERLYPAGDAERATREARRVFWNCVYP